MDSLHPSLHSFLISVLSEYMDELSISMKDKHNVSDQTASNKLRVRYNHVHVAHKVSDHDLVTSLILTNNGNIIKVHNQAPYQSIVIFEPLALGEYASDVHFTLP